ncbi:MAG: PEP-CTERM sorting domain-containing protein [Phycisphaerales bacterium]|nr:PEP-CTERM sorting domain-containing protein [Phycisphaerales bacterium]
MKTALPVMAGIGSLVLSAAASAAFTGFAGDSYNVESGGATYCVLDLYVCFDEANVLLNVFNANISNDAGADYHHEDLFGPNWNPNFSLNGAADSFVSIGMAAPGANSTSADPNFPNFGGNAIPANAGWFNSNPPNLQGAASANPNLGDGFYTFIGRFVIAEVTSPTKLSGVVSVTYNSGLGTPSSQNTGEFSFGWVPAPGALALLGLAGLAGSRRRRA